jgi:phosphoglycerol transferase MdoB-like AlkP superfamily enzyme
MKKILIFFITYFLFWVCFFVLFRIIFLSGNLSKTVLLGWTDFFGVFIHGSKMDISVAGYFTLVTGLLLTATPLVRPALIGKVIKVYTILILTAVIAMGLMDVALYPHWGFRLNTQILPYLATPGGVVASVTGWQVLLFIILFSVILTIALWAYQKVFLFSNLGQTRARWYTMPIMLIVTMALIIPIRGGLNTSPLNFSSVYFSANLYANHSAYNYFWTFTHAVLHNKVKTNPVSYFDDDECDIALSEIDKLNQEELPVYIKDDKPINVILVVLESFSNKVIAPLGGLEGITPRLNQYCKEGILFSSFYATGNRSDKGISSLFASYPALIKVSSVMGFPDKMDGLDYLPLYFKEKNYSFSCYYGGDVNFYNMRMLLLKSGVDKLVSSADFPHQISNLQNWGVPDQYLYERIWNDLRETQQPFFSAVYTISSHEPFDFPGYEKYVGKGFGGKYLNSIFYADSCLGVFVDHLKSSPLWENTLVVITSDHASLEPGSTTIDDPASYRIPMLWIGGVVDTAFVTDNIAMQTDLSSTLIQQLGWGPKPSSFSKNVFGTKHYAFFLRDEGWGFLSPETGFFVDLGSGNQRFFYGEGATSKDSLLRFSKSYVQFLHRDFLKR